MSRNLTGLLISSLSSEKITKMRNRYCAIVDMRSTKKQLRRMFFYIYGIAPIAVNTKIFDNKKYAYFLLKEEDIKQFVSEETQPMETEEPAENAFAKELEEEL